MRGTAEVKSRASAVRFVHRDIPVPALGEAEPLALAPLLAGTGSAWLALLSSGALLRIDLHDLRVAPVARVDVPALDAGTNARIDTSPDGRFASVVAARGRRGVVVDLESGMATMTLDRGEYHVRDCEFSVAFVRDGGRTVIVHATAWNRLDVFDPATGELLTTRQPTSYRNGEPRPAHYLDYFHCALTVSPDGRWLIDDGWVWHPQGSLSAFDFRRWLHENPWESEDGPSLRDLRRCDYFCDGPKCFIDDRTLAVWGFGSDDESMLDAAVLFDVETGERLRWFAGPPRGRFFFDRHLVVAAEGKGTSVWDVSTGERLHGDPAFTPVAHHPAAQTFLSVLPGGVLRESRMIGDA
ncbi:MAG: hypothetical protein K8T90_11330 [Planctomycetes bacterium]|nr:hypothetical protein [Planctomycetota bacterium]